MKPNLQRLLYKGQLVFHRYKADGTLYEEPFVEVVINIMNHPSYPDGVEYRSYIIVDHTLTNREAFIGGIIGVTTLVNTLIRKHGYYLEPNITLSNLPED